ncbi:hypothetical protein CVT24_001083 [Panaeolus cyanescens]|uniref:Uncharacterized protein n=1 Tax=Panaeolus cyanescens TaxID=181874 RepID=A0A409WBL3_9AGAR|nr:hypothetical protein CVT24_001083 [Panaeolus cyanescens]
MPPSNSFDIDTLTIRSPTPNDLEQLRSLVGTLFTLKEPLLKHGKISSDAFLTAVKSSPRSSRSLYMLLTNLDAWFVDNIVNASSAPGEGVGSHSEVEKRGTSPKILHLVMGLTVDEYENLGINKRLRAETLRKAKEGDWDWAVVECSNVKTQHLMRDVFGFRVGKETRFEDHEVRGKKPLEGMKGNIMLLYTDLRKSGMSYTITVRVYQTNVNAYFYLVEKAAGSGVHWTKVKGQTVLNMTNSGSSGILRFIADNGENFSLALGVHNYKRWCDIVPSVTNSQTGVTILHEYYAGRSAQREKQLASYATTNAQGRKFSVNFSVPDGQNLVCDVVIG